MKFKVGQIVELINKKARGMGANIGARAKVTREAYKDYGYTLIDVEWIKDTRAGTQMSGGYDESLFGLVAESNGQLLFNFMYD